MPVRSAVCDRLQVCEPFEQLWGRSWSPRSCVRQELKRRRRRALGARPWCAGILRARARQQRAPRSPPGPSAERTRRCNARRTRLRRRAWARRSSFVAQTADSCGAAPSWIATGGFAPRRSQESPRSRRRSPVSNHSRRICRGWPRKFVEWLRSRAGPSPSLLPREPLVAPRARERRAVRAALRSRLRINQPRPCVREDKSWRSRLLAQRETLVSLLCAGREPLLARGNCEGAREREAKRAVGRSKSRATRTRTTRCSKATVECECCTRGCWRCSRAWPRIGRGARSKS